MENRKDLSSLVKLARKGDESAWNTLYELNRRMVDATAKRSCGNFHDGEDAAQDAWLLATSKISSVKNPKHFCTWLGAVVRNTSQSLKRKEAYRGRKVVFFDPSCLPERINGNLEPIDAMIRKEQQARFQSHLSKLPQNEQDLLRQVYFEDKKLTEAANGLGLSTTKSRIHRAKIKLLKMGGKFLC